MAEFTDDWPDDADGGVFRNLAANAFDFSKQYSVDYNVDFDSWPPSGSRPRPSSGNVRRAWPVSA